MQTPHSYADYVKSEAVYRTGSTEETRHCFSPVQLGTERGFRVFRKELERAKTTCNARSSAGEERKRLAGRGSSEVNTKNLGQRK